MGIISDCARSKLLVMLALAAICSMVAGCAPGPQMYVGRTTVMERSILAGGRTRKQTPAMQKRRLDTLVELATSQKVLSNAAETLSSLGLRHSPPEILAATTVEPVTGTNIIAIEVTLPDAKDAKIAADVVAAEFKKAFGDQCISASVDRRQSLQMKAHSAESKLDDACAALNAYHRISRNGQVADPALAKLQGDMIAAKDTYTKAKTDLAEAILEEKCAKSSNALATIDPAFVRPAK